MSPSSVYVIDFFLATNCFTLINSSTFHIQSSSQTIFSVPLSTAPCHVCTSYSSFLTLLTQDFTSSFSSCFLVCLNPISELISFNFVAWEAQKVLHPVRSNLRFSMIFCFSKYLFSSSITKLLVLRCLLSSSIELLNCLTDKFSLNSLVVISEVC